MKQKNLLIIFSLVLTCIVIYILFALFFRTPQKLSNVPIVNVSKVQQKNIIVNIRTIGTVEAYSSVDVKSLVAGTIIQTGFNEGDVVEKDQLLFKIDPRPFEAALNQAKAELARNQATLANNQLQLERNQPLLKKGYIAKQDFDTLAANLKSAQALVQSNQAAVENAQLQLEYATILAPIPGKTGNIMLKVGSTIKANDTNPLVTIRQINPIYVSFSIPQDQFAGMQILNSHPLVRAKVNGFPEQGALTFIDNSVNTTTGTIEMKATFQNQDRRLWPGQYVRINFPAQTINNAVLIPSLAILTGQKGFYVFVVDNHSIAHIRYVTPGPVVGQQTVIRQGLIPNEQVISVGQSRVEDGDKVEINAQAAA